MRRIDLCLFFEVDTEANTVWTALKNYLRDSKIRSLAGEKSFIQYQDCHHDEIPPRPCEILERIEK